MAEAGRYKLPAEITNDGDHRFRFSMLTGVLEPRFHVEQILHRLLVEGMLPTDAVRLIPKHVAPPAVRMLLVIACGAVVGIFHDVWPLLSDSNR